MRKFDAVVIGAGAAGLMCAAQIGQKGRQVALIDHSEKLAEKIRISGGGRCNFTNVQVDDSHFVSQNPRFARHALSRYTPQQFISLVQRYRIPFHEKHKGQLFCDHKSDELIDMLAAECNAGQVEWLRPHSVNLIEHGPHGFKLGTTAGSIETAQLVIATGGLPVPKIGATDFGLRWGKHFGHRIVDTRPALVPLTFPAELWAPFVELAGVALPVRSRGSEANAPWFEEDLLFTHRGLSGPAVLQASSFWNPGEALHINYSAQPSLDEFRSQLSAASVGAKSQFDNWLAALLPHVPRRLMQLWLAQPEFQALKARKVAELGKKQFAPLAQAIADWTILPSGTEGYRKAEVMRGGISTEDLNPKTLESRHIPGLYFIGEVVDITGWLGGYNFQWAWASGYSAAQAIVQRSA